MDEILGLFKTGQSGRRRPGERDQVGEQCQGAVRQNGRGKRLLKRFFFDCDLGIGPADYWCCKVLYLAYTRTKQALNFEEPLVPLVPQRV